MRITLTLAVVFLAVALLGVVPAFAVNGLVTTGASAVDCLCFVLPTAVDEAGFFDLALALVTALSGFADLAVPEVGFLVAGMASENGRGV